MNKIIQFFTRKTYNGVQADTRSNDEKAKDWNAKESLVSSVPLFNTVKSISEVKVGTVRNQNGSGSCVTHALAKAIEMSMRKKGYGDSEVQRVISALSFYQSRSNKPAGGSSPVEMCENARKNKWYTEANVPSQNMSDKEMDNYVIAKDILKEKGYELNYFVDSTPTFNETAQYIELAGNAMLLVDTSYNNWCVDKPLKGGRGGGVRHEICAVDNVTLNNEKLIFVDESWGRYSTSLMGIRGQRMLIKETFDTIVEQVIYVVVSKKDDKLHGTFPIMKFGQRGEQITRLQDFLRTQGLFNVESTGLYGKFTARAVWDFQLRHNVSTPSEINTLQGRRVGIKTINKIMELI